MNKQLIDIARENGIEQTQQGSGEWRGRCPHRENHKNGDAHPACDINDAKNTYYCHTCNKGGGPAQYERALEASGQAPTAAHAVERKEVTPEMRAVARELTELGVMGLLPGSVGVVHLNERGISLSVADAHGIGVVELASGNPYGVAPGRYFSFTYADADGPTYVKLRSLDDKHRQCIVPRGAPQSLFLGDEVDATKPVAMTEGEFDAAALVAAGFENVVSVPNGAGTHLSAELLAPIAAAPTIYIATDNDTAGNALAERLAQAFGCSRCRRVTFGRHKDANEALMAGADTEQFQMWFSAAQPMVDPSWENPVPLDGGALPPFPIDSLDGALGSFVAAVAVETQTPVDMPAMMAIGIFAMLMARHFRVRATASHVEDTNLYITVGMDSGNRKSGVRNPLMRPIERHLREHNAQMQAAKSSALGRQRVASERLKDAEKRATKETGTRAMEAANLEVAQCQRALDAIEIPKEWRLFTTDATPEVLVPLMLANDGRMAIVDAEGTTMRNVGGRYSPQANFDVLLSAHGGDTLLVDRKRGEPLAVANPALTIALCVQPDVIRQLGAIEGARAGGLPARFLFALPSSLLGRRVVNPPGVPADTAQAYAMMTERLLSLVFERDDHGDVVPREVALSEDARGEYFAMCESMEPRLGPYGDLSELADWGSKLLGAVVRLAGILHISKQAELTTGWSLEIDVATFRAARRIGDYLIPHALAAFALMSSRESLTDAKFLKGHIERNTMRAFSTRDLFEKARGRIDNMERFKKALDVLVEHALVRKAAPVQREKKAGRPAGDQYEANPRWICPAVVPAVPVCFQTRADADYVPPAGDENPLEFLSDDDDAFEALDADEEAKS